MKTSHCRFLPYLLTLIVITTCAGPVMADAPKQPNILFCIADDASFPHMGAYGCKWVKTPGFDRVAREGLLFTKAYTPNAKCSPSRSCVLTGRNSWQLESAANHVPYFPADYKTICEALGENGYAVGFTGKGWAPGVAKTIDGKQRQLCGPAYQSKRTKPPAGAMSTCDYAANFRAFLDTRSDDQPFCFWYGGYEPHRAYEYKAGATKGGKRIEELEKVPGFWPDNEKVRNDILDYAFEIEYFDLHLSRILKMLEDAGELDNTLVVVTSDNGMPFPRVKGQEYEYSNHMPLAIMWKDRISAPGRVINDMVSFIDIAPTFLELAGLTTQQVGMKPCQGKSLMPLFDSDKSGRIDESRDFVLIGKERHDIGRPHDWGYPIRGIFKDDYLYLANFKTDRYPAGNPETGYLNCDGSPTKTEVLIARRSPSTKQFWNLCFGRRPSEELYNVKEDPECLTNLADAADQADRKAAMRELMTENLKKQGDPRMFGQGDVFDNYPYAHDNGRGFYERYTAGEKMNAGWVNSSDFEQLPAEDGK